MVPSPGLHDASLWWETIAVVTATAVVGWMAVRLFFVHRSSRPPAALTQAAATVPPPSTYAASSDAGSVR